MTTAAKDITGRAGNGRAAGALRVAVYQPEARTEGPAARLARLDERLAAAGSGAFDLVLCPELFLSGYDVGDRIRELAEPATGPSLERAAAIAARHRVAIALGYPEVDGGSLYNAVAVLGPAGERLLDYRKRTIPPGFERGVFAPGDTPGLFELTGWRIGVLVCFDVEFPELVREAALAGAEVILAPTALRACWTLVARSMIPTRAFENGVFVVYANHAGREGASEYLGESVILAPDGRDLARAGRDEALIAAALDPAAIAPARETLPYLDEVRKLRPKSGSVPC